MEKQEKLASILMEMFIRNLVLLISYMYLGFHNIVNSFWFLDKNLTVSKEGITLFSSFVGKYPSSTGGVML